MLKTYFINFALAMRIRESGETPEQSRCCESIEARDGNWPLTPREM